MELSEYQARAQETNLHRGGDPIAFYLLGLEGELGTIAAEYKKRLRDGIAHRQFTRRVAEEIGDLLWYAAALASELGLDLDRVAQDNLQKVANRWTGSGVSVGQLDAEAPEHQRLPRRFSVRFEADDRHVEVFDIEGAKFGDRLNDNARQDDNYRYHDAFHLAHAAVLGWSPVVRSMLNRKRKYDRETDEAEDGARAIFTEEGITAQVFKYAEEHDFFEGVEHIDSELLKAIQRQVSGLEVSVRSLWEWESAILQAYAVWRELVANNGGVLTCDLDTGTITFEPDGRDAEPSPSG